MSEDYYHNFIDGQSCDTSGELIFDIENPATGDIIGNAPLSTAADVTQAVHSARKAFDQGPWPKMSPKERAKYLHRIADLLEDYGPHLAELESMDSGMTLFQTEWGHIPRAVNLFRYFAEEAKRLTGECVPVGHAYLNFVMREPVGVAALIGPWNSPLPITAFNVAAALSCGNTCIVKPSELAPISASALAQVVEEAELPPGVFNLIHGGKETGEALVSHENVDLVAFTGGTATGASILKNCAPHIKKVGLELGGKSANIIFADADFDRALDAALLMVFGSNGEACFSGSRILVQQSLLAKFRDAFIERSQNIIVGDPLNQRTEMGPLISQKHWERVAGFVQGAQSQGATLACGGKRPEDLEKGHFFEPTVLTDVEAHMEIAQEEVFGPVACLIPFDNETDAVALANQSRYGLAGYIWSRDTERALALAKQVRAGSIAINSPIIRDIRVPFGGYKQSGIGRMGGQHSIDLFTEVKATSIPISPLAFPKMGTKK